MDIEVTPFIQKTKRQENRHKFIGYSRNIEFGRTSYVHIKMRGVPTQNAFKENLKR